jgi:hypothetical protein
MLSNTFLQTILQTNWVCLNVARKKPGLDKRTACRVVIFVPETKTNRA